MKLHRLVFRLATALPIWLSSFLSAQESSPPGDSATQGAGTPAADGAALSERERQLLERIETLERRMSELEGAASKSPAGAGVSPIGVSQTALKTQSTSPATSDPKPPTAESGGSGASPNPEPFAFADFTWLTGNPRSKEFPLQGRVVTGEVRIDVDYVYDFNHPQDHTISGSSEIFRSGEVQLTQFGLGGDLNWHNVRGRVMTQFGMYSQTTPRNDASTGVGQWNLDGAYRYISEAYGGYHIDQWKGINVDAGIFMSYVGLFSYYQFDNWAYQPSYVSSNTPWFFNGVRIQIYPSDKLKIEPWFVNGWQSYGKFNDSPGVGMQVLWRPNGSLSVTSNNYIGKDALGVPGRKRVHTDDSVQFKYLDLPGDFLDKGAATLTLDIGCEYGGGVSCSGGTRDRPSQYFLGFMAYNRFWFSNDQYAVTLGGGYINNPGRYLVLLPPINGATALSGSPYFTESPGDPFRAWDYSVTFDYMPR
ncbi:MAG TPA: outer membrane beta-barrel protein, partial [Thermoanaerobaculia bacterium]